MQKFRRLAFYVPRPTIGLKDLHRTQKLINHRRMQGWDQSISASCELRSTSYEICKQDLTRRSVQIAARCTHATRPCSGNDHSAASPKLSPASRESQWRRRDRNETPWKIFQKRLIRAHVRSCSCVCVAMHLRQQHCSAVKCIPSLAHLRPLAEVSLLALGIYYSIVPATRHGATPSWCSHTSAISSPDWRWRDPRARI